MKTFISAVILSLNVLIFSSVASAQVNYSQLGVRAGNRSIGLMARFYSDKSNGAIENLMMLDYAGRDFSITTIYEQHIMIPSVKGLSFYTGAGGHAGYYCVPRNNDLNIITQDMADQVKPAIYNKPYIIYWGIDAIGGIDYHFPKSAVHISADIKPGMSLNTNTLQIFNSAIKLGIDL